MNLYERLQPMNVNIRITKLIYILVVSLLLASCSNRQMYYSVQQNRQFECQKLPLSQYDECMDELDESYDAYEKKRKEIGEKNSNGAS